jgi:cytochrome P450/NADPH-cytochrome P450 reductase
MTYRAGDHLSVVPVNSDEIVDRVLKRFGFAPDAQIRIRASSDDHSQLPVDVPISVKRLLSQMLELQSVASRRDVAALARHTGCPHSGPRLKALAEDDYKAKVQKKRRTVLDLLEEFAACELPFGVFLELMPMLSPRYYSISSSPMRNADKCSITVGVVNEPAISGLGQFKGVCSNYLAGLEQGDKAEVSIRGADDGFKLPEDPATPVIMIGPGTGIAPFRGFLQERAAMRENGTDLGHAMLFFGCRHPDQDFIYREELEGFADDGLVDLHIAFSRLEKQKTYVQDLLRQQRDTVWALLEKGARVYVCGDGSRMEPDVRRALSLIYSEEKDVSGEAGEAWIDQMAEEGRYNLDVWVTT